MKKIEMITRPNGKKAVKVIITCFIIPDPQDRRAAHAPMCIR